MSKEVRRRQIKEENRERQRYKGEKIKTESEGKREKESTWSREEKGEEEFGKHTSLQSLLLQLCYLHSNNGGSASAEHLLINNRTGERRGAEGVGVGVLSLSRPGTKQSPVWTEWHFFNHRRVSSVCLCLYLYRYKTENCLFIFHPLGSNLDSQSTQGHAVASI